MRSAAGNGARAGLDAQLPRRVTDCGAVDGAADIRISEVIGALSYALDLTEGQPTGHAARACLIGMRLADAIELPQEECSSLFYALLMKDVGCSSNAGRVAELFAGDDHAIKREFLGSGAEGGLQLVWALGRHAAPGAPPLQRARRLVHVARHADRLATEMLELRCERGAEIAQMVGLSDDAAAAIAGLGEHWDGAGRPYGRRGEEIPLLARIVALAQSMEIFFTTHGREATYDMVARRNGRWFDPDLVRAAESFRMDLAFWASVQAPDPARRVARAEPAGLVVEGDDSSLDLIAEGFARVIDAKSPYTARHSEGVAGIADGIAGRLGFSAPELRDLRHAALLHDIGKLGVSNAVLDKPGKLGDSEWTAMRRHPEYTLRILQRVSAFAPIAEVAASHHERLDGSGYHRGVPAGELPLAARVLAVADVCEALTADRPYRAGMPMEQALSIMRGEAGVKLCPEAFAALEQWLDGGRSGWAHAA